MKKIFAAFIVSILHSICFAQSTTFIRDLTIPLYQNLLLAPLAYGGGINDGMFSEIDLNGDGIKDLFVFEKDQAYKKARITTYINNGTANQVDYTYAPQYISHFPDKISDWVILVDYNCDGMEDLLTYSNVLIPAPAGVTAYKNVSTPGNLEFQLDYPCIYANSPSGAINLYVSSVDKPAFVDEDGDGDIDAFSISVGGGTVSRYKNLAMETLSRCDTFVMEWQQSCWGNFVITYTNSAILGVACKGAAIEPPPGDTLIYSKTNNDGASCLLLHDMDGNGALDYLSGDPSQNNLLLVSNGGTPSSANMTTQDSTFPIYDVPAFFHTFLDPSMLDVNNDGLKDLLISPCASGDAENYYSVWYYKNVGTPTVPSFSFQINNLLIDQMADVGEGTKVCFFDADADGLKDLMVGNRGYWNGLDTSGNPAYNSGIAFYKNTGTVTQPAYSLQNIDWMSLFAIPIRSKHPTFGDLDGDLDADMIVGEESGHIYYFENTGGVGSPALFVTPPVANVQLIDVGKYAAPQLFDMNKDNLLDLVIGTELGRLRYYQNTGTATNFFFSQVGVDFGNVNVTQGLGATGRAVPFFYRDSLNSTKALVSNEHGNIFLYDNIDNNLGGTFTKIDSTYKGISEPINATISGTDINGDGMMDLVIGNQAGGFTFYKQVINTGVSEISPNGNDACLLYPVPAKNEITLKLKEDIDFKNVTVTIYEITGKKVYEKKMTDYYTAINLQQWNSGIYFCKITDAKSGNFINKKFIVSK